MTDKKKTEAAAKADPKSEEVSQAQLSIQRIYIKDMSFESPRAPEVFKSNFRPEINLDINSRGNKVEDDLYEVILSLTVTAKSEDKVSFLVEIQQAGLFVLKGFEPAAIQRTLGTFCPNVLFPYAREAISNVVGHGGFPQLLLAPVNFDALYAEALKRQAEQAKAKQESITH